MFAFFAVSPFLLEPIKKLTLVTTQTSPDAGEHLARLGARATVLRPDRHTLGAADSRAELEALLARVLPNPSETPQPEMV